MMGVVICLVVFVDSHGGLTNFAPGGKKDHWYKEPDQNPPSAVIQG